MRDRRARGRAADGSHRAAAADRLGVPLDAVRLEMGDSDLPPAGLAAGSSHGTSVCNVVARGCEIIRDRIARAASASGDSVFAGTPPETLRLVGGALRGAEGA